MTDTRHTASRYRVRRADRASRVIVDVGHTVYPGRDCYGCASDDSRLLGIDYMAVSINESGEPFFTIPREDVELLTDEQNLGEQR